MSDTNDCMDRVRDVLQVETSTSLSKKEADFLKLLAVLDDLKAAQRSENEKRPLGSRDTKPLVEWAKKVEGSMFKFEFRNRGVDGDDNWACHATEAIKKGDHVLSFPYKSMMTSEDAKAHPGVRACLKVMGVLQQMPTATLALFLITESLNENSRWKEYIKALPRSYALPMWYSPEQVKLMSGTALQSEFFPVATSAVQLYTMLWYKINWAEFEGMLGFGRDEFTYERWMWAFSAVTSRQNFLPQEVCTKGEENLRSLYPDDYKDGKTEAEITGKPLTTRSLALIPVWDMMNHEDGEVCTYFETDTDTIESEAMYDIEVGGAVNMFYGGRSSIDLMLHCGFTLEDNPNDVFSMSMIVSKKDRLFRAKSDMLACFKMNAAERLKLGPNKPKDMTGVLVMQRILSMGLDTIKGYRTNPEDLKKLVDPEYYPNVDEEKDVYTTLIKKVKLLKLQSTSYYDREIKGKEGDITSFIGKSLLRIRASEAKLADRMVCVFEDKLAQITQPKFGLQVPTESDTK